MSLVKSIDKAAIGGEETLMMRQGRSWRARVPSGSKSLRITALKGAGVETLAHLVRKTVAQGHFHTREMKKNGKAEYEG